MQPSKRIFDRIGYIFVCIFLVCYLFILDLEAHDQFWGADYAAIMADLSGGVQFPVVANNSIFAYILMGDSGEGTQQGAFWWDGGNYIWKQVVLIMPPFIYLLTLYVVI